MVREGGGFWRPQGSTQRDAPELLKAELVAAGWKAHPEGLFTRPEYHHPPRPHLRLGAARERQGRGAALRRQGRAPLRRGLQHHRRRAARHPGGRGGRRPRRPVLRLLDDLRARGAGRRVVSVPLRGARSGTLCRLQLRSARLRPAPRPRRPRGRPRAGRGPRAGGPRGVPPGALPRRACRRRRLLGQGRAAVPPRGRPSGPRRLLRDGSFETGSDEARDRERRGARRVLDGVGAPLGPARGRARSLAAHRLGGRPPRPYEDLLAAVVVRLRDVFVERYHAPFVVVIWPDYRHRRGLARAPAASRPASPSSRPATSCRAPRSEYVIVNDWHPSPRGHQVLAELVERYADSLPRSP